MNKGIFLLFFLTVTTLVKAQTFDSWQVENVMLKIPESKTYSTTDIAEYVKKNFDTDSKKVRAIYSWIISNFKYSFDSANIINLGIDPEAKITAALRRRKGVCENYAVIFNDICLKSGLTSYVIDGYTKQNGLVDQVGHNWCAVLIDNKWLLFDPTWDTGMGSNTIYFSLDPSEMITSHMPYDPMWQLLNYPVSHVQFSRGNWFVNKEQPFFNYPDSIKVYLQMDSLQKYKAAAFRIQQQGVYNKLVKLRLDNAKMNIEIIRQDKDVDLYNASVAALNEATNVYNSFVQYRNKQFTPLISDSALENLLSGIGIKLSDAYKKLDEIAKSEATFTFSTEDVKDKLKALAAKVNQQKEFLSLYINTPKPNRLALFYQQLTSSEK
jgi:hypothetical protein